MDDRESRRWTLLAENLPTDRRNVVVDVGANPLEDPAYKPLLSHGLCEVIGFEPQEAAYRQLQEIKKENETYFPLALGDGKRARLNVYAGSGLSSLLHLSRKTIAFLGRSKRAARTLDQVAFETVRLDDLDEIATIDLLKIDVQGAETQIFRNGRTKLADAVMVITEVRFLELYDGEDLIDEQIRILRSLGFGIHKFLFTKSAMLNSSRRDLLRARRGASQLLDGDCVFIRDLREPGDLSNDKICQLALLADAVVQSYDVTLKCLDILYERGLVSDNLLDAYVKLLPDKLMKQPVPDIEAR